MQLTERETDVLVLLKAAGAEGIAVDGLLTQVSGAGVDLTRESALACLRKFLKNDLAELRGARWYVTNKGLAWTIIN